MRRIGKTLAALVCVGTLALGCGPKSSGGGQNNGDGDGGHGQDAYQPPECPNGTDNDDDGYGDGCPAGPDCDDSNANIHPQAPEICNGLDDNCNSQTDEGVLNACGNCNELCTTFDLGNGPFPLNDDDPNAEENGVGLDPNGDLILDQSAVDFNFMWIANTNDWSRGTVSKIDTDQVIEAARYFSVTCFGNPAYQQGQCLDVAGGAVQQSANSPSRTAVDYNFDVWVANRAFGGQASATKIANDEGDCVDRNGNNQIDTSRDVDGDGHITVDCNGDNVPDGYGTVCTNGLPEPEFLGWDDECVLMTVNYAGNNELGRSICLDAGGQYGGAGNAWVGTNNRGGNNRFYQIDGTTGAILQTVDLPAGHEPYGCIVDSEGILWTVSQAGSNLGVLVYFDTGDPVNFMGQRLFPNFGSDQFYGVTIDSDDNVWAGGWGTADVYRYRPDRTSFATLANGVWARVDTSTLPIGGTTAGVAADLRGYIWVAANDGGCILRIPQNIPDGPVPPNSVTYYGPAQSGSCTLGGNMRGVGVDFAGHVWGVTHDGSRATRLEVDANGNPTGAWSSVDVGQNPYTYSDFTGYGLQNFTRPRGTYRYLLPGCDPPRETTWIRVEWTSTEPPNTAVRLRVRSGDDGNSLGQWFGSWDTSPADLSQPPPQGNQALDPNPAPYLQVEFELSTSDRSTTPVLHDFLVVWECDQGGPG